MKCCFWYAYQISNESFHEEIDSMVIWAISSINHKHVVNNLNLIFYDVTFYVLLFSIHEIFRNAVDNSLSKLLIKRLKYYIYRIFMLKCNWFPLFFIQINPLKYSLWVILNLTYKIFHILCMIIHFFISLKMTCIGLKIMGKHYLFITFFYWKYFQSMLYRNHDLLFNEYLSFIYLV